VRNVLGDFAGDNLRDARVGLLPQHVVAHNGDEALAHRSGDVELALVVGRQRHLWLRRVPPHLALPVRDRKHLLDRPVAADVDLQRLAALLAVHHAVFLPLREHERADERAPERCGAHRRRLLHARRAINETRRHDRLERHLSRAPSVPREPAPRAASRDAATPRATGCWGGRAALDLAVVRHHAHHLVALHRREHEGRRVRALPDVTHAQDRPRDAPGAQPDAAQRRGRSGRTSAHRATCAARCE